jgi:hypothetical protein
MSFAYSGLIWVSHLKGRIGKVGTDVFSMIYADDSILTMDWLPRFAILLNLVRLFNFYTNRLKPYLLQ